MTLHIEQDEEFPQVFRMCGSDEQRNEVMQWIVENCPITADAEQLPPYIRSEWQTIIFADINEACHFKLAWC